MIVGKITVNMRPVNEILKVKGLTENGDVQRFHTQNVLRRIVKYMPYRSGVTIKKTIAQSTSTEIRTMTPYAAYIHFGKVMVGPPPKRVTDRNLEYTKTKNPQAGPFWGRRLAEAESDVMLRELKNYVQRRGSEK